MNVGDNYSPKSGKVILDNGEIVNINTYMYNVLKNIYEEKQHIIIYEKRHKMIHEGKYFSINKLITVPAEDKKTVCGTTGNKYLHIIPPIFKTTLSNVIVNVYEDIEYHGGNSLTPRNHNRNFPDTTHKWTNIVIDATIDDYGSKIIYNDYIAGGTGIGGVSYGGDTAEIQEYIYKPNSKYCFDILNGDDSPNDIYLSFSWYWSDTATD